MTPNLSSDSTRTVSDKVNTIKNENLNPNKLAITRRTLTFLLLLSLVLGWVEQLFIDSVADHGQEAGARGVEAILAQQGIARFQSPPPIQIVPQHASMVLFVHFFFI